MSGIFVRITVILALLAALSLPADDDVIDPSAQAAADQFLNEPSVALYESLITDHQDAFVNIQGRFKRSEFVNWTQWLPVPQARRARERHKQRLNHLLESGSHLDYLTFGLHWSHSHEKPHWKHLRSIHAEESRHATKAFPSVFAPGREVGTLTLTGQSDAAICGNDVLVASFRHTQTQIRLFSPQGHLRRFDLVLPVSSVQLRSADRGCWILGEHQFWFINQLGSVSTYACPPGSQTTGWPIRLGDIIAVPVRRDDAPCEFTIARWPLSGGLPEREWTVMSRHDRRGRLRGQLWLPGPSTADHALYVTHCGGLLVCDGLSAQPLEWIPYPSLETPEILHRLTTEPWSGSLENGHWTFKPQDSAVPLSLSMRDRRLSPSPQALAPGPQLLEKGFVTGAEHPPLALIHPLEQAGQWSGYGDFWLHRHNNLLRIVRRFAPNASADDRARAGTPPRDHWTARRRRLLTLLEKPATIDWQDLDGLLRHPPLPIQEWLPSLWHSLENTQRARLWNSWLTHRGHEPFPLIRGLAIPNDLIWASLSRTDERFRRPVLQSAEVLTAPSAAPWSASGCLRVDDLTRDVVTDRQVRFSGDPTLERVDWTRWTVTSPSSPDSDPRPDSRWSLDDLSQHVPAGSEEWVAVTADRCPSLTTVLYGRRFDGRLRIRDASGQLWTASARLSSKSLIRCRAGVILVVDPLQGRGWLLSQTGVVVKTFPLLSRGPYELRLTPHHALVATAEHLQTFSRRNRLEALKRCVPEWTTLPPGFESLWSDDPSPETWSLWPERALAPRLVAGQRRLRAIARPVTLEAPRSTMTLRTDGILDDPYDSRLAAEWPGLEGARVMALHDDGGLLIGVTLPDATWTQVHMGPPPTGDLLIVAWDPLDDGSWQPHADDNALVVGPRDPNAPQPFRIDPLQPGERPFQGQVATQYDMERRCHIYEIYLPWSETGRRLPLGLNLAAQDDTGTTRRLVSWRPGLDLKDFIPRLMARVVARP